MAEEFLNGADVVAVLEEVGGEAVAKGVRGNAFVDFGRARSFFNGFLKGGFVNVVTAEKSGFRVFGKNSRPYCTRLVAPIITASLGEIDTCIMVSRYEL